MGTFLRAGTDKNIFLIIDNSENSLWRPKGIDDYSDLEESKFLFPPAAKFKVKSDPVKKTVSTGRGKRTFYEVKLKLVGLTFKKKLTQIIRKICRF
jgi:hypothetical protein